MSGRLDDIQGIVQRHMAEGRIAGAITLLTRDGHVAFIDVQGDDGAGGRPLRADSVFPLFSLTKPITAAAACALIESGRLAPEDPVAKYIPEFGKPRFVRTLKPGSAHRPMVVTPGSPFPHPDPSAPAPQFDYTPLARPLTVHDFLSFTSGLQTIGVPNEGLPPDAADDTIAGWVAQLGETPLEFQPGSQWHYSNATGYEVVARIIEVVSGTPFAQFVQQTIFDPLEMSDACFGEQDRIKDRLVDSAMFAGGKTTRKDYASGSAGAYATIEDYGRFGQMLLGEGTYKGRRILPAGAVRRMRTNQIGNLPFPGVRAAEYASPAPMNHPGVRYGYGVAIIADTSTSGTVLPPGSFGWDGVGTRRFWGIPALNAVLIMLMPGLGAAADPAHRDIEAQVCSASS